MVARTGIELDGVQARTGGRSARVREAVLSAVRQELMEDGYAGLSHIAVGRRAGVDPATVYRRWPSRSRLAVDAIIELAENAVPLPDTGQLESDLMALHKSVSALLADERTLRLFQAFSAASIEQDPDVSEALRAFWRRRISAATVVFDRAADRGEIERPRRPGELIEQLVAPIYFRALVTRAPLDRHLTNHSVARVRSLVPM
jgi:AcrR family transcriptional regulator